MRRRRRFFTRLAQEAAGYETFRDATARNSTANNRAHLTNAENYMGAVFIWEFMAGQR
jgi:hypothetical protein